MFRPAFVFFLIALRVGAQSQVFTSITIKLARSADPRSTGVRLLRSGNLIVSAVSTATLLSVAYDLPSNGSPRLATILPRWTLLDKYDIDAKVAPNAVPPGPHDTEARSRAKQMIRALLADRFGLVIRVENKRMSVYALTVATDGPKLQPSSIAEQDCAFDTGSEPCHRFAGGLGHPLKAKAIDMDDLVHYIGNWTDLAVVNRTALSGLFAVETEGWLPLRLPPPPPNVTPGTNPFAGLPTIFTVLGKLGLELKRQDDILPVYIVDRIERPAMN